VYYNADIFHVHKYCFPTSFDHGHFHKIIGVSSLGIRRGNTHVHCYRGVTTLDNGHVHNYGGETGPALHLPGGGHIHCYRGITTFDDGHRHAYEGTDFPSCP